MSMRKRKKKKDLSVCPKHGCRRTQYYRGGKKAGWRCCECEQANNKARREPKAEYMARWMREHRAEHTAYVRVWRAAKAAKAKTAGKSRQKGR